MSKPSCEDCGVNPCFCGRDPRKEESSSFRAIRIDYNAVHALQAAGHDVYWFDTAWYHSGFCPKCEAEEAGR